MTRQGNEETFQRHGAQRCLLLVLYCSALVYYGVLLSPWQHIVLLYSPPSLAVFAAHHYTLLQT